MSDFANNYLASKEVYCVGIAVGAKVYMYPLFCLDHSEALRTALIEHRRAGHPLPAGTDCYVDGLCQDRACDCGGRIRIVKYTVLSTTSGDSSPAST